MQEGKKGIPTYESSRAFQVEPSLAQRVHVLLDPNEKIRGDSIEKLISDIGQDPERYIATVEAIFLETFIPPTKRKNFLNFSNVAAIDAKPVVITQSTNSHVANYADLNLNLAKAKNAKSAFGKLAAVVDQIQPTNLPYTKILSTALRIMFVNNILTAINDQIQLTYPRSQFEALDKPAIRDLKETMRTIIPQNFLTVRDQHQSKLIDLFTRISEYHQAEAKKREDTRLAVAGELLTSYQLYQLDDPEAEVTFWDRAIVFMNTLDEMGVDAKTFKNASNLERTKSITLLLQNYIKGTDAQESRQLMAGLFGQFFFQIYQIPEYQWQHVKEYMGAVQEWQQWLIATLKKGSLMNPAEKNAIQKLAKEWGLKSLMGDALRFLQFPLFDYQKTQQLVPEFVGTNPWLLEAQQFQRAGATNEMLELLVTMGIFQNAKDMRAPLLNLFTDPDTITGESAEEAYQIQLNLFPFNKGMRRLEHQYLISQIELNHARNAIETNAESLLDNADDRKELINNNTDDWVKKALAERNRLPVSLGKTTKQVVIFRGGKERASTLGVSKLTYQFLGTDTQTKWGTFVEIQLDSVKQPIPAIITGEGKIELLIPDVNVHSGMAALYKQLIARTFYLLLNTQSAQRRKEVPLPVVEQEVQLDEEDTTSSSESMRNLPLITWYVVEDDELQQVTEEEAAKPARKSPRGHTVSHHKVYFPGWEEMQAAAKRVEDLMKKYEEGHISILEIDELNRQLADATTAFVEAKRKFRILRKAIEDAPVHIPTVTNPFTQEEIPLASYRGDYHRGDSSQIIQQIFTTSGAVSGFNELIDTLSYDGATTE